MNAHNKVSFVLADFRQLSHYKAFIFGSLSQPFVTWFPQTTLVIGSSGAFYRVFQSLLKVSSRDFYRVFRSLLKMLSRTFTGVFWCLLQGLSEPFEGLPEPSEGCGITKINSLTSLLVQGPSGIRVPSLPVFWSL